MWKKYNFFIVIATLGAMSLIAPFSRFQDLAQKNRHVELKSNKLIVDNKFLQEKQKRLQSDPIYAESVARQKLNVAKDGEMVYKIIPKE